MTLVAGGGVAVDQAFASRAVEELRGGALLLSGPRCGPLERGAERGFLGAIADGGGS